MRIKIFQRYTMVTNTQIWFTFFVSTNTFTFIQKIFDFEHVYKQSLYHCHLSQFDNKFSPYSWTQMDTILQVKKYRNCH